MRPTNLRPRAGFTLIEVVVAVILVDVALLSLTRATTVLVRRQAELYARATATAVAGDRLQTLIASACGAASGSATSGVFTERWSQTAVNGAIAARDLRDTVSYPAYGTTHLVVLATRLPC